jgi:hypothetical protein
MLSARVPRNLRVRSSIQISSTRVPARAFLIVAGLVFVGGLLIVAGTDLMRTVRLTAVLIVLGLVIFELRCWGALGARGGAYPRAPLPPPSAVPADARTDCHTG